MISVLFILLHDEQNKLITVSPSVKYVATFWNTRLRVDATYFNQLGHIVPTRFNMFRPFFAFCKMLSVHHLEDGLSEISRLMSTNCLQLNAEKNRIHCVCIDTKPQACSDTSVEGRYRCYTSGSNSAKSRDTFGFSFMF